MGFERKRFESAENKGLGERQKTKQSKVYKELTEKSGEKNYLNNPSTMMGMGVKKNVVTSSIFIFTAIGVLTLYFAQERRGQIIGGSLLFLAIIVSFWKPIFYKLLRSWGL